VRAAGIAARSEPLMAFGYYARLSLRNQAIYRQSDRVGEVILPRPELLRPLVAILGEALASEDRGLVEASADRLCRGITELLHVPPVGVAVLPVRPRAEWGELHGLYTSEAGRTPRIRLWMRTAQHRRVVAFRTFLRTLLHEVCHHLDYRYLKLADSFHTEGFFKRESSLFRQLVPEDGTPTATPVRGGPSSTRRSGP
jgi:hypothetical protein